MCVCVCLDNYVFTKILQFGHDLKQGKFLGQCKVIITLKYSDFWPNIWCYNLNVSTDKSFSPLRVFHVVLGSPHWLELNSLLELLG